MFCHDKTFVATKYFFPNVHTFGATKDMFCHDKTLVAAKMILVAAPAIDRCRHRRLHSGTGLQAGNRA